MVDSRAPTAIPGRHHPQRWWRWVLGVVALLAAAYVYQYVTKGAFWKATFERQVSKRAGRPVRVAGTFHLYLAPDLRFRADGLTIGNPGWAEADQFFAARRITAEASIWQLLFGDTRIDDLQVDGGRLALQRRADGSNTWTFGDEPLDLPDISRAAATDSRISVIDARSQTRIMVALEGVGGAAADGAARVEGPLVFRGSGSMRGAPVGFQGRLTTPNQAAAGGRIALRAGGRIADTRLGVAGEMPGATRLEGADLSVSMAGPNLHNFGRIFDVALPATRPYALAAHLTKAGRDYRLSRVKGGIGDTDITGTLTVRPAATKQERMKLTGQLASNRLDIKDVGPLFGYDPARISAGRVVRQEGGRPRLLPDAPLAIAALGSMDADVDYRAKRVETGKLPFTNFRLRVALNNSKLNLLPLAFDIATGRLIANIGIDARRPPAKTAYDIRLTQIPLGKLFTGFKVEDAGTTATLRARVQLNGVGNTVQSSLATSNGRIAVIVPQGTLWLRNVELAELDLQNFLTAMLSNKLKDKRDINCGIVAFTVRQGKAIADPIVIDSDKTVLRGRGGFDFGDESLAMAMEADSKQISLFSGQSPIAINGWFADPAINPISGELLARGAAGAALGIAASPLAALLAFIDPGDAKDGNCAPILAGKPARR